MSAKDSKSPANHDQDGKPRRSLFRRFWLAAAAILVGGSIGTAGFTFDYAQGTSYLSSESETCANCHVMQEHFDAWVKSSHAHVARCNDCHAPHDFVGKWYCKARNGYLHSKAFTLQNYKEPLEIHAYNRKVAEDNCRYCHQDLVHSIDLPPAHGDTKPMSCIRCHSDVGHPN